MIITKTNSGIPSFVIGGSNILTEKHISQLESVIDVVVIVVAVFVVFNENNYK